MCGICGKIDKRGVERSAIQSMLDTIRHRGPDDAGIYLGPDIGLGCRRLSIIDLEGGNQPIANEDKTAWIVFNGEIYNHPQLRMDLERRGHRFRTRTDTEVILHLYEELGTGCAERLRGMFAFAIWDVVAERLFLARDPLGQKPLYFRTDGVTLTFASEVKALIADAGSAPVPNLRALDHYLTFRYVPRNETLFQGIHKIPAACWLTYGSEGMEVRQYWDLDFTSKHDATEQEIVDSLHQQLLETVGCHLISDVPVGAFLSGGMDSSLIVSLMSEVVDQPVRSFSVGVAEADYSELPYARAVARQYGARHSEVVVGPELIRELPHMVLHMEEPVDPYAFGVYAAARLARSDVKVVLCGDGGDELFAGYDRYLGNRLVDFYCMVPVSIRRNIVQPLIECLPDDYSYNNAVQRIRWLVAMAESSGGERYAHSAGFLRFSQVHKQSLYTYTLLRELNGSTAADDLLRFYESDKANDTLDRMLYADAKTRLADHLLMIVDHMTMAHSLEARSPYVDQQLVEYVAAIPASLKLKGTRLRHIQRAVARRYFPASVTERRKRGFSFPLAYWFRDGLRTFLENTLLEGAIVSSGLFESRGIAGLIEEHASGVLDHNYRLWLLLNLEIWYRAFIDESSPVSLDGEFNQGGIGPDISASRVGAQA